MIRTVLASTLLALTALPLAAQEIKSHRLSDAQAAKFQTPLCPVLKGRGKAFDNGQKALRKAAEEKDAAKKLAGLQEAYAQLTQAATENPDDAATWYHLARTYLYLGDAYGADSAFTRTMGLMPACEVDIDGYRQNGWATLANAGIEFLNQEQTDSALALLREAHLLFRKFPHVAMNLGVVYANSGQADSAAVYFAQAVEIAGEDTTYAEDRDAATQNLAVMLIRQEKHAEAARVLRQYLQRHPDDMDAKRSLTQSFRAAGMTDSADALDKELLNTLASMNTDSLDVGDLMTVGVGYFRAEQYPEAAGTFEKITARLPFNRDAHYNLANTYLAIAMRFADKAKTDSALADSARKAWSSLIPVAQQLVTIDPMSADGLQMLAQAHRGVDNQEKLLETAEKLVGLPWSFEITGFQTGSQSARLMANLVGRTPMNAGGEELEPAPVTIVVEFLNEANQVVETVEHTVPVIKAGETHKVEIQGTKAGITAWRYHRKP
jgi:tetratricopeptide (TPR) repeat protein